jgi:hypothetical protein
MLRPYHFVHCYRLRIFVACANFLSLNRRTQDITRAKSPSHGLGLSS